MRNVAYDCTELPLSLLMFLSAGWEDPLRVLVLLPVVAGLALYVKYRNRAPGYATVAGMGGFVLTALLVAALAYGWLLASGVPYLDVCE